MNVGKDEVSYLLDYHHDEIEFLLDKIHDGYVLSKDEYDKIMKILNSDSSIGFSGDYNDLINKPDIVAKIKETLEELNVETSDTVNNKINSLQENINTIQDSVSNKAAAVHTHSKSDIDGLQSSLNSKADFLHYHDERYPTIEFLEKKLEDITINSNIDLRDYVTKGFLKEQLDTKSNKGHTHKTEEIAELDNLLALKADVDSVYDKLTIDTIIKEHNHNDDYYTKKEVDSNFATAEELVSVLEDLATKSDIGHRHDEDYYTKEEVEDKIEEGISSIDLSGYVKTEEMETALAGKSDIGHSHDEYALVKHEHLVKEIKDIEEFYYDKETTDSMLNSKADINHEHDVSGISGLQEQLNKKANKEDVYSKEEIDLQMNLKADADHRHDDIYYTKQEVEDKIDESLIPYATTEYVNEELAKKASVDHGHDISEINGLQDELDSKADKDDVYEKDELDVIIGDLNTKIDSKADVDHKHDEYALVEHEHETDDITDLFVKVYNKDQVDEFLAAKADSDHKHDEYAAAEHEHLIEDITDLLDNVYTEKEVDEFLAAKADSDHEHDEYALVEHEHLMEDITDLLDNVYTEEEVDEFLASKADSDHEHDEYALVDHTHVIDDIEDIKDSFYDKNEIDEFLSSKADSDHEHDEYAKQEHEHTVDDISDLFDNVYNKTQVDEYLASKAESNHKHDIASVTNLQEELDKKANKDEAATKEDLANKADVNHRHDGDYSQLGHSHDDLYYTEDEISTLLEKTKNDARIEAVTEANIYTSAEIANLVDSAPESLNTLNELAQAIKEHEDVYKAYVETVSTALASKADSVHKHNDIYYTKEEVDNKVSEDLSSNLSEYAKIKDMEEALATKSEIGHTHECSSITDLQEVLDTKTISKEEFNALKENVDTKAAVDHIHDISEIENLQNILEAKINKDEAATKEDLAKKSDAGHRHDDVYYTKDEIDNNITTKIEGIDFSVYATKEELATKAAVDHIHDISEIEDLQNTLETKMNKDEAATKEDLAKKSDAGHRHDDIYYTKDEIDNNITEKIDGIDFSVYATKEDLATKAEAEHIHDISEIEDLQNSLDAKANASDVYTKNETNEALALKMDASYKQNIDEALDLKLNKTDFNIITNQQIDDAILAVFGINL